MRLLFLLLICIAHLGYGMDNIDWNFIKDQEGFITTANVPAPDKSESGVTIASGFDLGARSIKDLDGLDPSIVDKLQPYLGLKKQDAVNKLKQMPLIVSKQEALKINEFAKRNEYNKLADSWKQATGNDFSSLPRHKATVIASVAFQYGNLKTKTPNFWKQVTADHWDKAYKNLYNFGDDYGSRRRREADYFYTTEYVNGRDIRL